MRGVTVSEILQVAAGPLSVEAHGHMLVMRDAFAYGVVCGGLAVFVVADVPPRAFTTVRLNAPEVVAMLRDAASTAAFDVDMMGLAALADAPADDDPAWVRWYWHGQQTPLELARSSLARVLSTALAWGARDVTATVVRGAVPHLAEGEARVLVLRSSDGWCGVVAEALNAPDNDARIVNEGELL